LPSRARWPGRAAGVGLELAVDAVADLPFEGSERFLAGLAPSSPNCTRVQEYACSETA
jgi:hypothetical protein